MRLRRLGSRWFLQRGQQGARAAPTWPDLQAIARDVREGRSARLADVLPPLAGLRPGVHERRELHPPGRTLKGRRLLMLAYLARRCSPSR